MFNQVHSFIMKRMDKEKIVKEYEKILEIPEDKSDRQIMICPIGVVGAGKTTIIKLLSRKLSLLRISSDEIRKLLKENGYGYDLANEIAFDLAEKYIEKRYSVAIDKDCVSEYSQRRVEEIKKRYSIKIFWIHINPPEEFIINKLKDYKHSWLFRDANQAIENYKSSKASHQNINFPFIYTFDTSRDDIEKQIKEAVCIINGN